MFVQIGGLAGERDYQPLALECEVRTSANQVIRKDHVARTVDVNHRFKT